jgi:hypothetical protein
MSSCRGTGELGIRLTHCLTLALAKGAACRLPTSASARFQQPDLGKAVRDVVGEMCPKPAPAMNLRLGMERLAVGGPLRTRR